MPFISRTDLKRPDLKGQFPCSVCGKIFCHSSSLSRHRMQAHFKSYICTQCNQEISSNETLRSHMYRFHQVSRMFMCRCCNWAFPDKTSLHIHMQSMSKNGTPGDVNVLAKSLCEEGDLVALDSNNPVSCQNSLSVANSPVSTGSPDELRYSMSPKISEIDVKAPPNMANRVTTTEQNLSSGSPLSSAYQQQQAMLFSTNNSIFPTANPMFASGVTEIQHQFETLFKNKTNSPLPADGGSVEAIVKNIVQNMKSFQGTTTSPMFQNSQWMSHFIANNPSFAQLINENKVQNGAAKSNVKLIQDKLLTVLALCSTKSVGPHQLGTSASKEQVQRTSCPTQQSVSNQPPIKRAKVSGSKQTRKTSKEEPIDLSLNIPSPTGNSLTRETRNFSPGKLGAVINNLLQVRGNSSESSQHAANWCQETERRNKRKSRVPTKADLMNESKFLNYEDATDLKQNEGTEQPSPTVSDSHTSGSSSANDAALSPKCLPCQELKKKLVNVEMERDNLVDVFLKLKEIVERKSPEEMLTDDLPDQIKQLKQQIDSTFNTVKVNKESKN